MNFNDMSEPRSLNQEEAEGLAIAGFVRISSDDALLGRFSDITGVLPNDMRRAASQPDFLVAVLDFYMGHEPDLLAWAEADGFAPDKVASARLSLAPQDSSGFGA